MKHLPSRAFNSSCGEVSWLIRVINHRKAVQPCDHFLSLCLRTHFIFIFAFIFYSIPSVFSVRYFLYLLLKFLYYFSLPASFFCLSTTFHCFRSFFAVLFLIVYFGLLPLLLSFLGICFNVTLPSVLLHSWPLFSFPISFGFLKLSSLLHINFRVCDMHATSMSLREASKRKFTFLAHLTPQ